MKYESSELLSIYKELLKSGRYTVITIDPQYGDLKRGFTFEAVEEPYHWAKITAWTKSNNTEVNQINVVPAKVLFDYLRLAISSASCVEVYEDGIELTYVYGEPEKH